jgi:hypothetical protein
VTELLTPEAFGRLFTDFEHTAFRLEVRSRYDDDEERKHFERYLRGEEPEDEWFLDWVDYLLGITGEGKRIERVRVVDEPPTDYQLWMQDIARRLSRRAGEDIRYLTRSRAAELGLPAEDYWLFDSQVAAVLHFEGDRLLGAELVHDPSEVVKKGYVRDAAWHHAVPVTEE